MREASVDDAATQPRIVALPPRPLVRLRKLCLSLPEAHEVEAWGEPTFRVRNKIFAGYASASNHHGRGRPAVWCKSTHVNQELLVRAALTMKVWPLGWCMTRVYAEAPGKRQILVRRSADNRRTSVK